MDFDEKIIAEKAKPVQTFSNNQPSFANQTTNKTYATFNIPKPDKPDDFESLSFAPQNPQNNNNDKNAPDLWNFGNEKPQKDPFGQISAQNNNNNNQAWSFDQFGNSNQQQPKMNSTNFEQKKPAKIEDDDFLNFWKLLRLKISMIKNLFVRENPISFFVSKKYLTTNKL